MQLRQPACWQQQHQQQQHKQCRQLVSLPQQQRCHIAHTVLPAPVNSPARAHQLHIRTAAGSPGIAVVTAAVPSRLSISTSAADPCLAIRSIDGKSVGALLAAMCGNALGAQVEPEKVKAVPGLCLALFSASQQQCMLLDGSGCDKGFIERMAPALK